MKLESIFFKLTSPKNKQIFTAEEIRKIAILNFFCIITLVTLLPLGTMLYFDGYYIGVIADLITALLTLILMVYFRLTGNFKVYRSVIIFLAACFFIYIVIAGGKNNTGLMWCYIFPLLSYYYLGYRAGTIANVVMLCLYGVILLVPGFPLLLASYSPDFKVRFILSNIFVIIFAYFLEYARNNAATEQERLINELKQALGEVKTLSGLLPICAECKKIRNDKGFWEQVESYIEKNSDAVFSHGICQECSEKLYGKEEWYKKD